MEPRPGAPASPLALSWDERQRIAAWLSLPEEDGAELLGGRIAYKGRTSLDPGLTGCRGV